MCRWCKQGGLLMNTTETENSVPGLKELQVHRARMALNVGWSTHRLVVIFYHLDGTNEPYTFSRLDTVQSLSDQLDSVWIKGEDAEHGLIDQPMCRIINISSEIVPISKKVGRSNG